MALSMRSLYLLLSLGRLFTTQNKKQGVSDEENKHNETESNEKKYWRT